MVAVPTAVDIKSFHHTTERHLAEMVVTATMEDVTTTAEVASTMRKAIVTMAAMSITERDTIAMETNIIKRAVSTREKMNTAEEEMSIAVAASEAVKAETDETTTTTNLPETHF